MSEGPRRLLVIDDSAVVRKVVSRLFGQRGDWSVDAAADPVLALDKIRKRRPDVILLDLEMPRMDGLTFLRHLMAIGPVPVVVCSGFADHGTKRAKAALEVGAVEIFPKPKLAVRSFLEDSGAELAAALERAVGAPVGGRANGRIGAGSGNGAFSPAVPTPLSRGAAGARSPGSAAPEWVRSSAQLRDRPILLGASLGGPAAIRQILSGFPENGPPCLIVQHMLENFAEAFTSRLDRQVAMRVRTATDGDPLSVGQALVAPGGHHMRLDHGTKGVVVRLEDGPAGHGHRPSVDVLFESAAEVIGSRPVAALLTGMGADGAEGLLALRTAGASTIVQDEGSSVVFGMPGTALALDAAVEVLPLERIGPRLVQLATRRRS